MEGMEAAVLPFRAEDLQRLCLGHGGKGKEGLWTGLLDYATVYADGRLTFTFKNGSTFEG